MPSNDRRRKSPALCYGFVASMGRGVPGGRSLAIACPVRAAARKQTSFVKVPVHRSATVAGPGTKYSKSQEHRALEKDAVLPDMYVTCVWLPGGVLNVDAGEDYIGEAGDAGLLRDLGDDFSDPNEWVADLRADISMYARGNGSVQTPASSLTEAAQVFIEAFSHAADPEIARRGLLTRFDLPQGGAILAAGGEFGGENRVSVATLHCATTRFAKVAEAMGAVPPTRWALSVSD